VHTSIETKNASGDGSRNNSVLQVVLVPGYGSEVLHRKKDGCQAAKPECTPADTRSLSYLACSGFFVKQCKANPHELQGCISRL
jgi:hypothetical protein